MAETIAELETILNSATAPLKKVTSKKMFGCQALWADGSVFALVWKHGRIGFKLPDSKSYDSLISLSGAEPWKAGPMKMAHWVLVPTSMHSKSSDLKKWSAKAHEQCSALEKKPKKSPSKKKTAAKGN